MTSARPELFGTPAQQALLLKGHALYHLLKDDPRYTYYGRNVGLATPADGDVDTLETLVQLQAGSLYARVEDSEFDALARTIEARGFQTTKYARWSGGPDALKAAENISKTVPLRNDVRIMRVDKDTSDQTLAKLAEVALACGVLPISGAVLRGHIQPGLGLVALDASDRPVACAAAAAFGHPQHPRATCWWGMLATHPDRRGERLALVLGAHAMLDMHHRYGTSDFFTGVEPGNAASEAVCHRIGLAPDGTNVLSVADPSQLPGGRMTK